MRERHVQHLRCPRCVGELQLEAHQLQDGRIKEGSLNCRPCGASYPIVSFIPRFVSDEAYTAGFGLQWSEHSRTQYDGRNGSRLSETRFFEETRWSRRLDGQIVIEAGSGSGRFTEHALSTGALVLSFDYSRAVEANYRSNGDRENLLLVQGDLFQMPFPLDYADRVVCLGLLQHTPDPVSALRSLALHLKPGGHLVADIYAKTVGRYLLGTKYWIRPLARRIPPQRLYKLLSRYVDLVWPVARKVGRIPKIGRALSWRLLIADYSDVLDDDERLRDWARLEAFDMLSPRYDKPAREKVVKRWCAELGLESVEVQRGYNGIEIRARRAIG